MEKPSLPSGTRDFDPEVMMRRKYIISRIEKVFKLHGFLPLETPALENLRTLQGKYGDEGDQLLFRVLNSGDFLSKADEKLLQNKDSKALTQQISDRGLRYDLTVPLARFVVMNRDKIHFPFRRYQIQPVWRADRPQKGRYREFWQCDADVVGSRSVANEADLLSIYDEVFESLDLKVNIRVNHRGLLDSFEPMLGGSEALSRFMQLIDKADKIGFEGVKKEIENVGIENGVQAWSFLYEAQNLPSNEARIAAIAGNKNVQNEHLQRGLTELKQIFDLLGVHGRPNHISLDLTLARGLGYYTGCVMEVVPADKRLPQDFRIGSIGGGGRYDNLTGVFGLKDVSGVGISFGLDRIYDILEAAGLFPNSTAETSKLLICPMTDEAVLKAFELGRQMRLQGIATEVYPGATKLKKQLDYANARQIPFAGILGEDEMSSDSIALKNLFSGEQVLVKNNAVFNQLELWSK
jgi:histidyl-tRNA synthetase